MELDGRREDVRAMMRATKKRHVTFEELIAEYWADRTRVVGVERTVTGPDGVRRYGAKGAAGVIVRVRAGGGDLFLLGQRAWGVQHPYTWSVPGGAVGDNEPAVEAAMREAGEELRGLDMRRASVVGTHVIDFPGGWSYTYVMVDYYGGLHDVGCGWETEQARWLTWQQVCDMPWLHPDFENALPALEEAFGL